MSNWCTIRYCEIDVACLTRLEAHGEEREEPNAVPLSGVWVNSRRADGLIFPLSTAGMGRYHARPPSNLALELRSDTRCVACETVLTIQMKLLRSFLYVRSNVRSPEVLKSRILPVSAFFNKLAHNSETRKSYSAVKKSALDSSF